MNHPLIEQISRWLAGRALRHEASGDRIVTGFGGLADYRDRAGLPRLGVLIRVLEGGSFLAIEAPNCYRLPAGHAQKSAALEAALQTVRYYKMLRWEYDPADGEVRASIHLPLEDAALTEQQFFRALMALPQLLDDGAAAIQRAIQTGRVEATTPTGAVFRAFTASKGQQEQAAPPRAAGLDLGRVDPGRN